MTYESVILIENVSDELPSGSFQYSDKFPGAGYHRRVDSMHTAVYSVNSFVGTIKLQGTLELYPSNNDWFDIENTEIGGDSTILGNTSIIPAISTSIENISINFQGNFIWVRAAYSIQNGSIVEIRYNH